MITKKQLIVIAAILADNIGTTPSADERRKLIARELAKYFATQNDLFDTKRFLRAANVDD